MLRRIVGLLSVCWLLVVFSSGQSAAGPEQQPAAKAPTAQAGAVKQPGLHLVRVETITAPAETATGFLAPVKCDGDGNIYFRQGHIDAVHKLSPKGERVALFQAAAHTDKKIDGAGAFALVPDGDLYQLVFPHEFDRYMFVYRSDGAFKSAIKLDPGFVWFPHALGVFPSGQLLVAGSEYDRDRKAAKWPFTGIFAADGSLLKEVKLEDDETLRDMAAAGDERVTLPQFPGINRSVDLSQVEMAADGNGYLMRWTNPAIIYAISPGGEVVRRLKIDPGDSGYRPAVMHVSQNRIAVLFVDQQTYDFTMRIVDLEGHELATYHELRANSRQPGAMLGNSFACYSANPGRFVFLGTDDDYKLQLWIAEPR